MTAPEPFTIHPDARVHLIGIGGAGMSALACLLLERGHEVSGSDLRRGRSVVALEAMGAECHVGHDAALVEGADVVAVSTAVPAHNPELRRAAELRLPVLRRAELLAAVMEGSRRLLVAGTHGKTTTTSMTTVALQAAGLRPSFAIGGALHDSGASAHHGDGDVFVAEADESDGSFLVFSGDCVIVTNVELDHHDRWTDLAELDEAFAQLLAQRREDGLAIVCLDDAGSRRLAERAGPPVLTYGEDPSADLRVVAVDLASAGSSFALERDGRRVAAGTLRVPGRHNVLNAAAALAAAEWAGADLGAAVEALAEFSGAQRRFQRVGEVGSILVVDDYAHHPTEVRAVLAAARQVRPTARVVAVFQPHRYSRTAALGRELGHALADADLAVVTDVYASGEAPVPGVSGAIVVEGAQERGLEALHVPSVADVPDTVAELARPGDLVLLLGAGDITESAGALLRSLEERA